jgi:hypothetical protein
MKAGAYPVTILRTINSALDCLECRSAFAQAQADRG